MKLLDRRYSLLTAHQERARQESSRMGGPVISTRKAPQACIILESLAEASETNAMGPRVLFASNSIDRVINADSSDVQGLFFLALVAAPDVAKAGRFLDRVMEADNIVIERLAMLADPLGTEEEGGSPRAVSVEIIAAGADDGAIMLCQLAGSSGSRFASARDDSSSGYMSLEEIISSEPETSDVADVWRIVG
ncbi:hypothetical protein H4R26_001939 [Coemansia thaxteri]|uniref:Uncharacterized protein n=1 Tax=Coemansia thaxteri TaxID=2663907 RepID=A0A9W8BF62_9FUNG|nr:hypothetical protein H4R26_001939 [Coemansia thaxteri]